MARSPITSRRDRAAGEGRPHEQEHEDLPGFARRVRARGPQPGTARYDEHQRREQHRQQQEEQPVRPVGGDEDGVPRGQGAGVPQPRAPSG
ncbi:MAG TPA: hypothetical protein VGP36_24610, partial [Mycobacteriales bacterium]|nr:hypothetical protein [Mycobacteriales bacterium]